MRSKFDQQLAALNQELTEMGATCAQAIGLAAQALEQQDVALVRIEQLYPFPEEEVRAILADYSHVTDFVWCQEEPQNQGAWYSTRHHYDSVLPSHARLRYAGRPASASPAVGYMSVHAKQQKALVEDALTLE